jgi:ubiquinone/menaquinone biosynthesis C-methylase UbiE
VAMTKALREYYEQNPLMVSSPFGGVEGIRREVLMPVLEALEISFGGRRVFDAGCGRGFIGDLVRDAGGQYTGMDFVRSREGFPFVYGEATFLPIRDASFDAVLCIDVFEHIADGLAAAREFRRVLRPGGFVFLSSPNYANTAGVVKWFCETAGWYEKNTWAPFRQWQPQEWETMLTLGRARRQFREAGFTRCQCIAHDGEVGLGLFPWIDHKRMPEAVKFRLQRLFARIGPSIARACPWTSLHGFWRMDVDD